MPGPQAKSQLAGKELNRDGNDPAGEPIAPDRERGPSEEPVDGRTAEAGEAPGADSEERELMEAIRDYQRTSKRMFPTWSEVLEIMQQLGYRKTD